MVRRRCERRTQFYDDSSTIRRTLIATALCLNNAHVRRASLCRSSPAHHLDSATTMLHCDHSRTVLSYSRALDGRSLPVDRVRHVVARSTRRIRRHTFVDAARTHDSNVVTCTHWRHSERCTTREFSNNHRTSCSARRWRPHCYRRSRENTRHHVT
jgi:hypothetical protein